MGDSKKMAKLTTFMLAQDFLPEHWNWDPAELQSLCSCDSTAHVILQRLSDAGLVVKEAYAIRHDKDEHELWNEYENRYTVAFTSNHIHFVCKLANGETLENIAKIIGVAQNFIAKPKAGRYMYDDSLSYLIHIKYPKKFQYDPHDVITVKGKKYIEYYREGHRRWMHGRAEKIIAEAEYDLKDVKRMIMDGEIGKTELFFDERFKYVYQLHMGDLDRLVENHNNYMRLRKSKTREEFRTCIHKGRGLW